MTHNKNTKYASRFLIFNRIIAFFKSFLSIFIRVISMHPTFTNYLFCFLLIWIPFSLLVGYIITIYSYHNSILNFLIRMDFRTFYASSQMVLHGVNSQFYDLSTQFMWQNSLSPQISNFKSLMPYIYPPFIALLTLPVTFIDFQTAYFVYMGINIIILLYILYSAYTLFHFPEKKYSILVFIILLLFTPNLATIMQGQYSLFLSLSLLLSWKMFKKNKEFKGGLFLSFLSAKPQFFIIPAIVLLVQKRFSALKGFLLGNSIFFIISLILVGSKGIYGYINLLLEIPKWGDKYSVHPKLLHTWKAFIHVLFYTDYLNSYQLILWVLGIGIALFLLLSIWKQKFSNTSVQFDFQWCFMTLILLFTSPHANYHDLSLLLVPGIILLHHITSKNSIIPNKFYLLFLLILGYILISLDYIIQYYYFPILLSVVYILISIGTLFYFQKHKLTITSS